MNNTARVAVNGGNLRRIASQADVPIVAIGLQRLRCPADHRLQVVFHDARFKFAHLQKIVNEMRQKMCILLHDFKHLPHPIGYLTCNITEQEANGPQYRGWRRA